jgi:hydroxymethylpyrimidine/phosphomethylpyrimidine kinase
MDNVLIIDEMHPSARAGALLSARLFTAAHIGWCLATTRLTVPNDREGRVLCTLDPQSLEAQIAAVKRTESITGVLLGDLGSAHVAEKLATLLSTFGPVPILAAPRSSWGRITTSPGTPPDSVLSLSKLLVLSSRRVAPSHQHETTPLRPVARSLRLTGVDSVLLLADESQQRPSHILYDGVQFHEFPARGARATPHPALETLVASFTLTNLLAGLSLDEAILRTLDRIAQIPPLKG